MADKVQVKTQDLTDRKKLKEQLREEQQSDEDNPPPPEKPSEVEAPQESGYPIIPPHYATVRFHTNLGPPGSSAFVEFLQFDIIRDQYKLYWLKQQNETRVVPLEVDTMQCPKCKTVFAGVPCLAQ